MLAGHSPRPAPCDLESQREALDTVFDTTSGRPSTIRRLPPPPCMSLLGRVQLASRACSAACIIVSERCKTVRLAGFAPLIELS
jgi:hypothetical protein